MTRHKVFTTGYDYVESACVKPLRNRKVDASVDTALNKSSHTPTLEQDEKASPKALWIILLLAALTLGGGLMASKLSKARK